MPTRGREKEGGVARGKSHNSVKRRYDEEIEGSIKRLLICIILLSKVCILS